MDVNGNKYCYSSFLTHFNVLMFGRGPKSSKKNSLLWKFYASSGKWNNSHKSSIGDTLRYFQILATEKCLKIISTESFSSASEAASFAAVETTELYTKAYFKHYAIKVVKYKFFFMWVALQEEISFAPLDPYCFPRPRLGKIPITFKTFDIWIARIKSFDEFYLNLFYDPIIPLTDAN